MHYQSYQNIQPSLELAAADDVKQNNKSSEILFYLIYLMFLSLPFLPVTINIGLTSALCGICLLAFAIKSLRRKFSPLDFMIIWLTIIMPLIGSYRSNAIFGQPFFYGLASYRGLLGIYLVYFFASWFDWKTFLPCLVKINIWSSLLAIVLLYGFHIDNFALAPYLPSREDIVLVDAIGSTSEVRGLRLTYICLWWPFLLALSYTVWNIFYTRQNQLKNWLMLGVFLFYATACYRGRIFTVAAVLIFVFYVLKNFNRKFLISIVFLIIFAICAFWLYNKFIYLISDFVSQEVSTSGDFSGYARRRSLEKVFMLIDEHYFWGIGNISYHFNDGYYGLFGESFYIADIGIFGSFLWGGVALIIFYLCFYCFIFRKVCSHRIPVPYRQTFLFVYICGLCISFIGVDMLSLTNGFNLAYLLFPLAKLYMTPPIASPPPQTETIV